MALPCRDGISLALCSVKKRGNPVGYGGGVLVRIGRIEVVGVEEGRVNANGMDPCGACHAHVIERVAEVGRFSGRGCVAERGEAASQWCRIGLLLDRVITVDRRADEVSDASATELPRDDLPIARSDDAEWDPRGNQSLQRRVGAIAPRKNQRAHRYLALYRAGYTCVLPSPA